MSIDWKVTKGDNKLICEIVDRAAAMARRHGLDYHQRDILMDLTACHLNAYKLRLKDLRDTDDVMSFSHDIYGIRQHLNRETGKLEDCFVPRFAA